MSTRVKFIDLLAAVLAFSFYLLFSQDKNIFIKHQLVGIDGKKLQIPDKKKNLTWVSFWSISCAPCLKEMPELQKIHQKYERSNDLQIMTIAMHYDPPNLLKEVQSHLQLILPIGLDLDGKIAASFNKNMTVPSHYLLDSQGNILYSRKGVISRQQLKQQLQKFLGV